MERNYTPSKAKMLCCFTRHFKLGPEDPSKERNYERSKAKKHNRLRYRILCCFTRHFKLGPGDPPAEVRNLYENYSEAESGQMTVGLLRNFMAEVQGESGATEEDAHRIMEKLKERLQLNLFHRHHVPWETFSRYLMSDDLNPPINGKTFQVKVSMGDGWSQEFKKTHFDNYSPPDFYTRVGIAGVKADTKMERTRAIEDDWTPCWDEEFEFPLTVPELALLWIEVHEYDMSDKDDFGGQTCLPVAELKPGIRAVPLYNKKGEKYTHVKLLMRFEFH